MMRWWWFGPAVEKPELKREMLAMKAAGIGGFEVQPVYPLALDDAGRGIKNLPYLSQGFLDALGYVNQEAHRLGLRVDITLASGWPYGGSYVPVEHAAGQLRIVATPVPQGADSVPLPNISEGESLIAAFLAEGDTHSYSAAGAKLLPPASGPRLVMPQDLPGQHVVLFFLSSRTGQQVKRAAIGAEGFVLDHFDRGAIDLHLQDTGDALMRAFGSQPPYAVFSDSLEVYGSDWTPDFLQQFRSRRGYDLTPYLPLLAAGSAQDEKAADIRHDWGLTLTELIDENYLSPIEAWARQHGTRFRAQAYGDPAVTLSSNNLVDLPEGEGPQWRGFSYTRWATSASHLYDRPITSAETWTWLHSPAFRATPLDMKAEADLFFLQGVNQLVGHGWPYSPPSVAEPGWAFYAAAVFNDHNPWSIVMPDIARYLQRSSFLLRQGKPANDVALFLPTDDAYANFSPANVSVSGLMPRLLGTAVVPRILDAGFNLDYTDAAAIDAMGVKYRVLVLPGVERIPLGTYRKIAEYAAQGGVVIATRRLPERGAGLKSAESDSDEIRRISRELFSDESAKGHFLPDDTQIGAAIARMLTPDMKLASPAPALGFIHRKLAGGDIYFLANTSNRQLHASATFRVPDSQYEWWDPFTGKSSPTMTGHIADIDFAPYESRFLVFHGSIGGAGAHKISSAEPAPNAQKLDISSSWSVTFPGHGTPVQMSALHSWTDEPGLRFFSGSAEYEKTVDVPRNFFGKAHEIALDFGPGAPIEAPNREHLGTEALLESPVREAALVYVDGKLAGSIWRPPYALDVTGLLQPGSNRIRIVVANTAINALAGRTLPDYRLLNSRYGERFVPQDMQHLELLPSGITGTIQLISTASAGK